MEVCRIEIDINDIPKLQEVGIKYSLKLIDVPDFDYSKDEVWQGLKSESSKAYRKLKQREFDLRNNI